MPQSKSVLVLIGDREDLSREESYWNSMCKINANIQITYCLIDDFEKDPPKNNYDSIIIWGHGTFKDAGVRPSGKKHRKDHYIEVDKRKGESRKTSKLVEFCSKYSKNILVTTCFAGALMKDLEINPIEADVVALGGSKHLTLRYTSDLLEITNKFIQDGIPDLIEFASPIFLDTFQIKNKDKNSTKLSAIKINQAHPKLTRILYTSKPLNSLNSPLQSKEIKKDSWWIENQVKPVKDLGQSDKNRLLGLAIAKYKINDVLFWLSSGADPNATLNFFGITPTYYAAELGHLDIVKALLIDHNADPNQARSDGITPLYVAAEKGHLNVVRALVALNADPNQARSDGITPLYVAAERGDLDVVSSLLALNAHPNQASSDGITPLYIAAVMGHLHVARTLLAHNADPNQASSDGITPLYVAAKRGHLDLVKALFVHHADPNQARSDGITPLYVAAEMGHLNVVRTLLAFNADPNQARSDGITPLYVAAERGLLDVVKALFDHHADPNQARSDGSTPLYVAAEMGHLDVVKALLDKGAKPNVVSSEGSTPWIIANQKGHLDVAKVLKDAIAKNAPSEKAAAEKAAAEKAAAEKAAAEKAAAEKAAAEKAAAEKAAAEKAAAEKAAAEKAAAEKAAAEKAAAEKAAAEKAAAEKTAAEKADDDEKAAAERTVTNQALIDKEGIHKEITFEEEEEEECDLIVKDLLKLTLEYQKRVKVNFIELILKELLTELNANETSISKIQGFYTILASQNSQFCKPNTDVIKMDGRRSALNFIAGISIILISLATFPISVFILGAIYHKTKRHPLDLFKTEGERLIKELNLIKEKNIPKTLFFKPTEEKQRSGQEPDPESTPIGNLSSIAQGS